MDDLETFYPDDDLENADWTKQSWDLPPYKSDEFNALVKDLAHFRTLPVYKHAVRKGLIVNDEWVGRKRMADPKLKELDDGTVVAFFDKNMEMVNEEDPKAEIIHAIKPDGTSIWGVKTTPKETKQ